MFLIFLSLLVAFFVPSSSGGSAVGFAASLLLGVGSALLIDGLVCYGPGAFRSAARVQRQFVVTLLEMFDLLHADTTWDLERRRVLLNQTAIASRLVRRNLPLAMGKFSLEERRRWKDVYIGTAVQLQIWRSWMYRPMPDTHSVIRKELGPMLGAFVVGDYAALPNLSEQEVSAISGSALWQIVSRWQMGVREIFKTAGRLIAVWVATLVAFWALREFGFESLSKNSEALGLVIITLTLNIISGAVGIRFSEGMRGGE